MRILHMNPDITQRELAEMLGISVGGSNFFLKALIEMGLLKMNSFANAKNKFGYVYELSSSGIAQKVAVTQKFLQRKMGEYGVLKEEI